MSKIVFNPVHKEELQLQTDKATEVKISDTGDYYTGTEVETALQEIGNRITVIDTRTNILALTPTLGKTAISTDEPAMYIANGTVWKRHPIVLGTPSTGIDIGAIPYNDDKGYGERDLSGKDLHNTVVAGYDENINGAREGAIRYTPSVKKLTGYVNGAWRNFLAYSDAEEDAIILWTDVWNTYDSFGKNIIHGHAVDMGPFTTDHIFHGGVISSQVI